MLKHVLHAIAEAAFPAQPHPAPRHAPIVTDESHASRTLIRLKHVHDDLHGRRLAAPALAHDPDVLPLNDVQSNPAEHLRNAPLAPTGSARKLLRQRQQLLRPVSFLDILQFDSGSTHGGFPDCGSRIADCGFRRPKSEFRIGSHTNLFGLLAPARHILAPPLAGHLSPAATEVLARAAIEHEERRLLLRAVRA